LGTPAIGNAIFAAAGLLREYDKLAQPRVVDAFGSALLGSLSAFR